MAEYDLERRMQLLGEKIERSREESERKWLQTEKEYAILRQLQAEGMRETFALGSCALISMRPVGDTINNSTGWK